MRGCLCILLKVQKGKEFEPDRRVLPVILAPGKLTQECRILEPGH